MKKHLIVILVAVLMAGCASAVSYSPPLENQEERIKKLLIGNWDGYIVENSWVHLVNSNLMLRIFEISKERDGHWKINAVLNQQSLEYIELYVYEDTIILKIMNMGGGLFTLNPHGNMYLLGEVSYGRGRWTPHRVVLKKISD